MTTVSIQDAENQVREARERLERAEKMLDELKNPPPQPTDPFVESLRRYALADRSGVDLERKEAMKRE